MKINKSFINVSGIYCIENTINKKKYVGSSKNIYYRLHKHKNQLLNNKHPNSHLQNAINKYGIESFRCFILEIVDKKQIQFEEQKYIDSTVFEYNKNLSATTTILSESSRIKVSNSLKKGYKNGTIKLTKTVPIEVYDLNGKYLKSYKTIVDASKDLKISVTKIQAVLRNKQKHTHNLQFKRTNENKEILPVKLNSGGTSRIRKIKVKKVDKRVKPCVMTDLENNTIYTFKSVRECARFLNCRPGVLNKSIYLYHRPYKNRYVVEFTAA